MSRFYTHKINFIERTKLLEGVVCQSLTFTNSLGNVYTDVSISVAPVGSNISPTLNGGVPSALYNKLYRFPSPIQQGISLPSLNEIGQALVEFCESENGVSYTNTYIALSQNGGSNINAKISINGAEILKAENYEELDESILFNPNIVNNTISYTIIAIPSEFKNTPTNAVLVYYLTISYSPIFLVKNHYPTKPWTITSGINRVLDLAEPIYLGETPRFELNPIQAQKWENTPLPETTMTQCTLREQLQHIGNYVHGQARLGGYLNETVTYNGKTYSAGYYENMIFYDEYGNQEESTLQGKPYVANQIRHSINEYNTKIETNAQNIVNTLDYADGVITTPDSLNFKTLRTENINIRLSESNSIIETELPIYDIISVKVKAYSGDGDSILVDDSGNAIWDITPFIFEAHEYNNLTSYGGAYPYAKEYALYYTQGQKNLDGLFVKATKEVGGIFGEYFVAYSIRNILESVAPSINWENYITNNFPLLSFQVSYIPFYETKYSHTDGYILGQEREKPFAKIYNQSENVIETRFYGENIKGVAQRLGNKEATRTYILGHINGVPKIGTKLDGYYISQVLTEYAPFSIKCTVGLTEKFNRLSQNVGINSHKRVAEISEKQAYDRNILIKEYICIGSDTGVPLKNDVCQRSTDASTLFMFTGVNNSSIDESNFDVQSVAVSRFFYKDETEISEIKSPVVSSAFGNCITFSWNMKDNYSAGTEVVPLDNGYWQKDVPYGDYYGRAYYMRFDLHRYLYAETTLKGAQSCNVDSDWYEGEVIRNYYKYKLRKDSREIIKMNLAIEYVTNRQDLIICSGCANCNLLVSSAKKGKLPGVYFFAEKTTNFDNIQGRNDLAGFVSLEAQSDMSFSFEIPFNMPSGINFKSWVIAYGDESESKKVYNEDTNQEETVTQYSGGEILIACNNGLEYYVANGITEERLYIKKYSDRNKDYESA